MPSVGGATKWINWGPMRWKRMLAILPVLGQLAWRLGKDPRVPKRHRAVMAAAGAYAVVPLDIALDFVPVIGRLDDILILAGGIAWVLRHAPPEVVDEHLGAMGLTRKELAEKIADSLPPPLDRAVANYEVVLPELEEVGRSALEQGVRVAGAAGRAAATGGAIAVSGGSKAVTVAGDAVRRIKP
jgi:uncharacterized membrane protein YkvA (DUF1232 family)